MSKKKLFSLALVVVMIAILSFSTLAWFNDNDEVKNEFHIATSDDPSNPDNIFSVTVWEDKNNDGNADDDVEGEDKGLIYEDILPGALLPKHVYVQNTGAYDQYIRVVVTLSDAKAWMEIFGSGYDLSKIFVGHDEDLWTRYKGGIEGENLVYVYYLNEILEPGKENAVTLFTDVKLPTTLTQQQMAMLAGSFELSVKAHAIQTENLGEGVNDAKTAFQVINWGTYTNDAPIA